MAGEVKKLDYVTDKDGVKYGVTLTPITDGALLDNTAHDNTVIRRRSKNKGVISFLLIILIVATLGGVSYYFMKQEPRGIPSSIVKTSSFPLFYPINLPETVTFDEPLTKFESDILYLTFASSAGSIVITQQSTPDEKIQFVDSSESYDTEIGKAYVLNNKIGKIQVMIQAEKTLLFVNCDEAVTLPLVKSLILALRQAL